MFGHDEHDENNKPADAPADDSWQHPGPPPDNNGDDTDNKPGESEAPRPESPESPESDDSPAANFSISQSEPADDDSSGNDLIDLKQEALGKLSPLVSHLDQSADEKFRTLMMMIQASDNQGLVREAYETALKIDDEKERAQALLDIVNEINYFTQNPGNNNEE